MKEGDIALQKVWIMAPLYLLAAQLLGNTGYLIYQWNEPSRTYYLFFQVIPQAIFLYGLTGRKYWAWVGSLVIGGYNIFDFAKALIINPAVFTGHFKVFMITTVCVNVVIVSLLAIQKGNYES